MIVIKLEGLKIIVVLAVNVAFLTGPVLTGPVLTGSVFLIYTLCIL